MVEDERWLRQSRRQEGRQGAQRTSAREGRQAVASRARAPVPLRGPWRRTPPRYHGRAQGETCIEAPTVSGSTAGVDELHKVSPRASVCQWCKSCSSARPRRRPPAGRRRCLCAELSGKTTTEASPVTDGAYFVRAPASQRKRWRRACLATPKPIPLVCYAVRRR